MFDRARMVPQALRLQKALKGIRERVEVEDGAVAVTAKVVLDRASFSVEIQDIEVDHSRIQPEELPGLIKSAVNQANRRAMQAAMAAMQELAGGLNLPGT